MSRSLLCLALLGALGCNPGQQACLRAEAAQTACFAEEGKSADAATFDVPSCSDATAEDEALYTCIEDAYRSGDCGTAAGDAGIALAAGLCAIGGLGGLGGLFGGG